MEESGGGGEPARVSSAFTTVGGRQRFEVELRPGETTIVSWKKLVKDAGKAKKQISAPEPPPIVHPAVDSRIAPGPPAENEATDAPPASRFSAVIEKIERLYMGKNSSDEEDLNDVPDDDEYDTEDSFIDDTELDEYFQVDNSAIKHDGFFVNRGKLERTNEPTLSPTQQPKKRRRKDLAKGPGGSEDGHVPNKHVKVGKKAAGRSVQSIGNNSISLSHVVALPSVHREDVKLRNPANNSENCAKKNSVDAKTTLDPSPSRVSNGGAIVEEKDGDKQKTGILSSKTHETKLKDGSVSSDPSNQRSNDKVSYVQCKSQAGRLLNNADGLDQSAQRKEKNSIRDQSDINVPEGKNYMQTVKVPLVQRKEGSSVKQKSSMLEKAIRELEKMVAESRPPSMEVSDADIASQAVKKRMPPEIKQKLAKVARLAQASHGRISKELLNRLMSIVGHLVQLRTLKRNLKIMVNMGLSAKQEKDARFQQIKKEVEEMVKVRVPFMKSKATEQQIGASDDFQETGAEEKEIFKRKFSIDDALEDRICDLYDLYVEGLDEDAAPQVRKLYAELAELWPKGFMDNHGIKRAICRAKDRKRTFYTQHKNEERIKRKKSLLAKAEEPLRAEATSVAQSQHVQEKSVTDSVNHKQPVPSTTTANTAARIPNAVTNGPNTDRPKQEKAKAVSTNPNDARTTEVLPKKKIKRKPESELGEAHTHARPEKLTAVHGEEKHKAHKQVAGPAQKANNLQSTVPSSAAGTAIVAVVALPPPPSFENTS